MHQPSIRKATKHFVPKTSPCLGILIFLVFFCSSCNRTSSLENTKWKLVSMNGTPPLSGKDIKLNFIEQKFQGHAGCNMYSGEYKAVGKNLDFLDGMSTEKGCGSPEIMEQEKVYLDLFFHSVTYYRLNGKQLELLDQAEKVVLIFALVPPTPEATLEGTLWELTSFVDGKIAHGYADAPKITLRLENNQAQGSGGCNTYRMNYTLSSNSLKFDNIGQTKMACPEKNAMEQENEFFGILGSITTFEISEDRLFLATGDGRGINFRVQP